MSGLTPWGGGLGFFLILEPPCDGQALDGTYAHGLMVGEWLGSQLQITKACISKKWLPTWGLPEGRVWPWFENARSCR